VKISPPNDFVLISAVQHIEANPDAKRLYDDLLSNYNRLIRPVANNTETLTVWLGLKITQIIEVSLRNQVDELEFDGEMILMMKLGF
jgi:nicotinic acetylcholine receptor